MEFEARIEALVGPSLEAMGYGIVRVRLQGTKRRILQIMIERADENEIVVKDCAAASAAVSALLDVEDPIAGAYQLEMSSPGIDRPLVKRDDFVRYTGFEARIETKAPLEGRKRFRGRLMGVTDDAVRLHYDSGTVAIELGEIATAQLLLTDELIAAMQRNRT
jgi:ribosome maturation factor RimP